VIKSEITVLLKDSVAGAGNAGDRLASVDIEQAIRAGLHALQKSRPYYVDASITLVADQERYTPPDDFVQLDFSAWGTGKRSYDYNLGIRPHILSVSGTIQFTPAPTAEQMAIWGSTFNYIYRAKHVLNETPAECTLQDEDEGLLLLRASAELMRILASRNVVEPVQLHNGIGNVPTSGTPGVMYEKLMAEYRLQAANR
jgi:hypothetical protein